MIQVNVAASVRRNFGKGAMRSLRREGQSPAVLYGPGIEPIALALGTKEITKTLMQLHGQNAVVTLDIAGEESKDKRHVMIKEIQKDPVRDTLIHADFYEISLEQETTLPVQVEFKGTPKGVDMGGVLHVVLRDVHITGLPLDIPDSIEADISSLELGGDGLKCKDLVIPDNVTLQEGLEDVCATVVRPTREVEEVAEGEEMAEEDSAAAAEAGATEASSEAEA